MAYYSLINGYNPELIYKLVECESSWQVDATNTNKDLLKTKDYGLFQLNSYWQVPTATKMGLDIKDPEQHIIYAFNLLRREGLKPWEASKFCWSKAIPLKDIEYIGTDTS